MQITPATPAEADAVLELLAGAARWIRSKGINQWTHYLDGSGRADLLAAIGRGEVYLFSAGGRLAGTISLQMAPSAWDRQIWGAVPADEAIYVHRLAIDRNFAGLGLGDRMLDWAEQKARAAGRPYLRLDCVGANERLNAYYQRRFTARGQAEQIGMTFSRYELALG